MCRESEAAREKVSQRIYFNITQCGYQINKNQINKKYLFLKSTDKNKYKYDEI